MSGRGHHGLMLGDGGAPATDPYWSSVVLSVPMTSDFTDVTGKTVTVSGAVISSGSGLFDGTNDRFSLASHAGFGFASEWTFEVHAMRDTGAVGNRCLFDTRTGANTGIAGYVSAAAGSGGLTAYSNAGILLDSNTFLSDSTFGHLVWTRENVAGTLTLRCYHLGVQIFSGTDARTYATASTFFFGDNYVAPSQPFKGRAKWLRVTDGVCRYPGGTAFTPPTGPYPTS